MNYKAIYSILTMLQRPGDLPLFPPLQKEGLKSFIEGTLEAGADVIDGYKNGFFSNTTLLSMLLMFIAKEKNRPKTSFKFKNEYDYIIVGGGSSGSVLANRLSEMPCVSVLLLEAGPTAPLLTDIPAAARAYFGSDICWNYRTTPQEHCAYGMKNREVLFPMGKVLGGTSVINGMLFTRGNKRDYDQWAAQGAKGWSYKEVLPYFLKIEDNKNPEFLANGYHGTEGPVTIDQPNYTAEIKEPILKAAKAMGYKIVDPNLPMQSGFYDFQATIRNGRRCSAAKAYLVPAENRKNLDILTKTFVRKVLIENQRAVGVEFDYESRTYQVKARREVIISAGTVNSAKILLLSGIGPREHLEQMQIPLVADLPVGENLHDHVSTNMDFLISNTIPEILWKIFNPKSFLQYLRTRSGPLASTNQLSVVALLGNSTSTKEIPTCQLYFGESSVFGVKHQFSLNEEVFKTVYGPYEGRPISICLVSLLQPKSRGTVTLRSKDPYLAPDINPNYYAHPEDVEAVVNGLKVCHKIGTSKEMKAAVDSKPLGRLYPGCEEFVGDEDKYYACQAKTVVFSTYHPVGTTKMGHPDDSTTVVDPELRVKSVAGLRVVCAAAMPIVPSGNTNIPAIMMAEKASDMIKNTVKCK